MKKVAATFKFEQNLWKQNLNKVVGLDEVGRGAWAGPLVAAAVIFPKGHKSQKQYFDSKLLSFSQRFALAGFVENEAEDFGIGEVSVTEVIDLGLTRATQVAYKRALENLTITPQHYLIDAFYLDFLSKEQQTPIIHGDRLSASIAAASIIAKVYRDKTMIAKAKNYLNYGFENNKGYGTIFHQEAIKKLGLSDFHRTNYKLQALL